jgi:hypothetical protein
LLGSWVKLGIDLLLYVCNLFLIAQSKDGKIKNASNDTWYITFPASYQGIYLGPITKSIQLLFLFLHCIRSYYEGLNLKTGAITIKNLSNDMDLKLCSYRVHSDAIDVVKKGT